jgi:hypothetical protein
VDRENFNFFYSTVICVVSALSDRSRVVTQTKMADDSGISRNFGRWGGVQQIQLKTEDRDNGDLRGGSPPVRGSGGNCNLVRTRNFISYSKTFLIFGTLRLFMMTTNLFVIANVKHLRT